MKKNDGGSLKKGQSSATLQKKQSFNLLADIRRRIGRIGHKDVPQSQCFRKSFMCAATPDEVAESSPSASPAPLSSRQHSYESPKVSLPKLKESSEMAAPPSEEMTRSPLTTLYASATELDTAYSDWVQIDDLSKQFGEQSNRSKKAGQPMTCYENQMAQSGAAASAAAVAESGAGKSLGHDTTTPSSMYEDVAPQQLSNKTKSRTERASSSSDSDSEQGQNGPSAYEELSDTDRSTFGGSKVSEPATGYETAPLGSSTSGYEESGSFPDSVARIHGTPSKTNYELTSSGYENPAQSSSVVLGSARLSGGDSAPNWRSASTRSVDRAKLSWSQMDHSNFVEVMRRSNPEQVRHHMVKLLSSDQESQMGVLNLSKLADALKQSQNSSSEIDLQWMRSYLECTDSFWNASSADDVKEALRRLEKLARDFQQAARTYASIIINEMQTPNELKTIPSSAVGGIAGGEKYIKNGILFKFAVDTCIRTTPTKQWMYGGSEPNHERAAKAAGYELANLVNFAITYEHDVKLPLMCLIDHLGYRIIAIALVPISGNSLVYGSNDGGRTVHTDDASVNELMERSATWLGLAPHDVRGKKIYGPGDIEVHRGTDGRLYALDFARLMPPEAPHLGPDGKPTNPRSVFYKFLRGELVRQFSENTGKKLCSDAFTGWNYFDQNRKMHENNVVEATDFLLNRRPKELRDHMLTLPAYQEFSQWYTHFRDAGERTIGSLSDLQVHMHRLQLDRWVHSYGVNIRYIGILRQHYDDAAIRCYLLSNIVARTLKSLTRDRMRRLVSETSVGSLLSEWPFKEVVADHINKLFLKSDANTAFWCNEIKPRLSEAFPGALSVQESSLIYDLRESIDPYITLVLYNDMLGVELETDTMTQLWTTDDVEVYSFDVTSIRLRLKSSVDAYMATGILSWMNARDIVDNDAAVRLLRKALQNFDSLMKITSSCAMSHSQRGNILVDFAQRYMGGGGKVPGNPSSRAKWVESCFKDAIHEFSYSLELRVLPITLSSYASALRRYAEFRESQGGDPAQIAELRAMAISVHEKQAHQDLSCCERSANLVYEGMKD